MRRYGQSPRRPCHRYRAPPRTPLRCQDAVIAVGLLGVKIVDKEEVFAEIREDVIVLLVPRLYKGVA